HREWALKAADAGKHVLSEKPLTMDLDEAASVVSACRSNNVQLMDGVMWVHHDRTAAMKKVLVGGGLGEIRRVTSAFAFNWGANIPTENIRARKELGGGSLGDLGYYCVRAILWVFGELPESVFARARYENDVDIELSCMLFYPNDRTASLDCGFTTRGRCWLEVAGSEAALTVDDYVLPASEEMSQYWVNKGPSSKQRFDLGPCVQEAKMIENFSSIVQSGVPDDGPPRDALNTVRVCCALAEAARTGRETPVS
ncbi:unnamed protein product, partial [marine sediment metagenome]